MTFGTGSVLKKPAGLYNIQTEEDDVDVDEHSYSASANRSFTSMRPLDTSKQGTLKQPQKGMKLTRPKTNSTLGVNLPKGEGNKDTPVVRKDKKVSSFGSLNSS